MALLFKNNEQNISDQQVESLIRDLARGRIGTAQEDYQTLKRLLAGHGGQNHPIKKTVPMKVC